MVGMAAGSEGQRQPTARDRGRRRAAGIYGSIITAATSVAALLGIAMILLKNLVLLHLH